jgi:triacylglycerol lipase
MGGLVLRHYLTHHKIPQLGQVVMMSPPNHGSEWADLLLDCVSARALAGPAAIELRTVDNEFLQKLGPFFYNLGEKINFYADFLTNNLTQPELLL